MTVRLPYLSHFRALSAVLGMLCSYSTLHADTNPAAQMLLGNPDSATQSVTNLEHFLISRPQYALSFNDRLRLPNWVSWHLNASDIGSVSRGQFQPDAQLPEGFTVIVPRDYTNSGYDRGHNCPSADRTTTRKDNDALFLMTNITPQAHGMNAGPWEQLESYCRELAKQGNELYIICGHGFSSPTFQKIGRAQVAVPDFGWKLVVVLPDKSGDDLRRINAQTRVIAVRMPNINTVSKQAWSHYIVTPIDIEKATGLKFFSTLPNDVATALKLKRDDGVSGNPVVTRSESNPKTEGEAAQGQVWVNTRSGVFWRPGTRYYGKTKEGKYMTEEEAVKAGYRATKGQE
jgi:endonuclease G, mitochondrial